GAGFRGRARAARAHRRCGGGAPAAGAGVTAGTGPFDGKAFARQVCTSPGVYRMYAADDTLLYVGKARALKPRVASYFNNAPRSPRTQAMLAQLARMEVTVTRTEAAAPVPVNQPLTATHHRH